MFSETIMANFKSVTKTINKDIVEKYDMKFSQHQKHVADSAGFPRTHSADTADLLTIYLGQCTM